MDGKGKYNEYMENKQMENKAGLKRRTESIELELYCECDGVVLSTIWCPGSSWRIEISGENIDEPKKLKEILYIFNSAKMKFDKIISRLEREYKQYDKAVSELPQAPKSGK